MEKNNFRNPSDIQPFDWDKKMPTGPTEEQQKQIISELDYFSKTMPNE